MHCTLFARDPRTIGVLVNSAAASRVEPAQAPREDPRGRPAHYRAVRARPPRTAAASRVELAQALREE